MDKKDLIIQELKSETQRLRLEIADLKQLIQQQFARIEKQADRISELEKQLNKDSNNSSKPPSSDGLKKKPRTQSLREKGKKRNGGQIGHPGSTLNQIKNPEVIERHRLEECPDCGTSLKDTPVIDIVKRQVFDIPQPKMEVTEHQVEIKLCGCCQKRVFSEFPEGVDAPVQYGNRIRSIGLYMMNYHYLPLERLSEFFEDVLKVSVSEASLGSLPERLDESLTIFEEGVKQQLLSSYYVHGDETGVRVLNKLHWLHVISTPSVTLFQVHEKRGIEGLKAFAFYQTYCGFVVHDHWHSYFQFSGFSHVLCNAHHLRELTSLIEHDQELWANRMRSFLFKALNYVSVYRDLGECCLPSDYVKLLSEEYDEIIVDGLAYHAGLEPLFQKRKRGRFKQRDGKNLLDRFVEKKGSVLNFMYDFRIPFTNNQAERDIRMMKLKQKVSGGFRTMVGAKLFAKIRGYISTVKKQGWNVLECLTHALEGKPRCPEIKLPG